jgi:hypothetical protein
VSLVTASLIPQRPLRLIALKAPRFRARIRLFVLPFKVEHLLATFGTSQTRIDTLLHVLADVLATLRTGSTNFRTRCTELRVHFETRQHRICCRSANLRAVQHQSEVSRFDVLTALLQAMSHRHVQAHAMAVFAIIDAGAYFLMHGIIGHELLFHHSLP